jgi:hypothetical protein
MVRPAKAFTAEQASEKDLQIIEAQLGRTPRDVLAMITIGDLTISSNDVGPLTRKNEM